MADIAGWVRKVATFLGSIDSHTEAKKLIQALNEMGGSDFVATTAHMIYLQEGKQFIAKANRPNPTGPGGTGLPSIKALAEQSEIVVEPDGTVSKNRYGAAYSGGDDVCLELDQCDLNDQEGPSTDSRGSLDPLLVVEVLSVMVGAAPPGVRVGSWAATETLEALRVLRSGGAL